MPKQPAPWVFRPSDDLRARGQAAIDASGLSRNAWLAEAVEEKIARGSKPAPPPAMAERAARTSKAAAGNGNSGGSPEYRFQTRAVGSIHQWRQDGATQARTAPTLAAVRDAARAAIRAAGETRPFTIKLVSWRD